MNVVQLVMKRQYRGAEIFAGQLSRELSTMKVNVLYVSLYSPPHNEYTPNGVKWVDLNIQKSGAVNLRLIKRLRKCFTDFNPDIVQANAGDTLKYAVLIKMVFGFHYRIIFRNASTSSAYLKNPFKQLLYNFLLNKVDLVISVSNLSKADILLLFPFLKTRTVVIPIGIDLNEGQIFPKEFNEVFVNKPVFVHVGGFTFEKNHEGLISIFEKYYKKHQCGTLVLIGEGPLKAIIEKLVKDKHLNSRIKFLGNRNDAWSIIGFADVLLLPSKIEGLPAVILEAYQAKVPAVAYDVGGIHEVVKNGETGWLVKKDDEDGFLAAIEVAAVRTDHVNLLIQRAHELVTSRFSNRGIAEDFLKQYIKLVK